MILTDDFIYIHQPKTGGTFVTKLLEDIYGGDKNKVFLNEKKHAGCAEIPQDWLPTRVLTTIRNPYERYVSQYAFGWWRRYPEAYCGASAMQALFPNFPDISFGDFVLMANELFTANHQGRSNGFQNTNFAGEDRLGWHTEQFVRLYCKRPREVFSKIDDKYIDDLEIDRDLFGGINYLYAENLNQGLHDFLLEIGVDATELATILTAARIYPEYGGRKEDDDWRNYYSEDIRKFIRRRERLLFSLFPQYDDWG